MAQSYGNPSTSAITAAVDEILGTDKVEQQLGTSLSHTAPTDEAVTGTLTIKVDDATVAATVTITALTAPQDIATAIQTQMRAAAVSAPATAAAYSAFVCRYDARLDKYILISGTSPDGVDNVFPTPDTPAKCVVTGGTAAAALKLGTANGGTEAFDGSEVITYTVKYRFVFDSGASYGGADIVVESGDMADPTDLVELQTIADARAAQIKAEKIEAGRPLTSSYTDDLNGPVTL